MFHTNHLAYTVNYLATMTNLLSYSHVAYKLVLGFALGPKSQATMQFFYTITESLFPYM